MTNYSATYLRELEVEPGRTDHFVISYPKTGRTWHRAMVGNYLASACGVDKAMAFALDKLTKQLGLRRVLYSHNGANFIDNLEPENPLVANSELWTGKPVTLLVRDPRDILVSAYHHAAFRACLFTGSISEFIRDRRTGIEKILTAYNQWHARQYLAERFRVVSYEQMFEDSAKELRSTLMDIGVANPTDELLRNAVENCRFENMREHEKTEFYRASVLKKISDDPRTMKVRAGKVGGYRYHLSADDLRFIQARSDEIGDPFQDYYSNMN